MKKEWKLITVLGIVAVTCGLYTWGIPAAVNIKAHKSYIEQIIKEKSGCNVDIGNPSLSMGWFPSVWIKSDNIALLNDDGTNALSVANPKLKLKLLPLLMKKFEITKVSATQEELNFSLNKESKFLIGQYLLSDFKNEKKSEFMLSKMDLNLGPYIINLDDKKNNQKVSLSGDYFKHGKYVQNKQIKFATKSILKVNDKQTDIFADIDVKLPINSISEDNLKIDANIKDFDISTISDYVCILTKNKIKSLGGILNFDANTTSEKFGHKNVAVTILTEGLKIIGDDKASSVIYDDKLSANVNFTTVENGVVFEKVNLNSNKIHINLDGKVYNIGNGTPKYNIQANVNETRLEDVVAIFPWSPKVLPEFNLYNLKKYVLYGNGDADLSFVGQGNRPHVNGFVKLDDAYLIHPIKNAPANITVDMKFKDQEMQLDAFGPLANNQSVSVKGKFKIDGSKYSEIEVKSTDSVDLAPVQEVLVPLHEILNFQLGPVPLMTFSGLGNVDIRSAGRKIDPHIWGRINFRKATAAFNEIHNLVLNNGSGEVVFDDTKVTFKTYQAFVKGKPIEIYGDCVVMGQLNVYVSTKSQDIKDLVKIINSSPILVDVQTAIKPFTKPQGIADVFLHIYGVSKNAAEVVFGENLFAKGTVTLHNVTTVLQDTFLPFKNVNGVVNFDQYNSDYDVTGYVRNSKVHVYGTGSNSELDLKAQSDKVALNDIFDLLSDKPTLPYQNEIGEIFVSANGGYKGFAKDGEIDYDKIYAQGKLIPNIESDNPVRFDGGTFNIRNGFLSSSLLKGYFHGNPCSLSFVSKDLDKEEMNIVSADFNFKDFDISSINEIKDELKLSKDVQFLLDSVSDLYGVIDVKGTISNNRINANTDISNTGFTIKPFGAKVKILNGNANIRDNNLYLDRVNSTVSSMPVFVNGRISDIYSSNPRLHLNISSKLTQQFFDRFFNLHSVYPVKTKGDINLNAKLDGPINALGVKSVLDIAENSSLYYMGATLAGASTGTMSEDGLSTNPLSIETNAVLYPSKLKLNSLKYNQIITSQNKKISKQNQLEASGEVSLIDSDVIGFNNFRIKTNQPTNARIFNVLFKKPTIKQGVFTADLMLNGTSVAPDILGVLSVNSIDIPVFNSTVRDINVDFKPDYIYLNSKSVVLTNDLNVDAKIVNKSTKPLIVEDVQVTMDELDMNVVSSALSDIEADNTRNRSQSDLTQLLEPNSLIIKNADITADKIIIKKANATDFKSHFYLDENQLFNIDNYSFNIANGVVNGSMSYNLNNLQMNAAMSVNNADAQIISENFFDMPGQMYGIVTGDLNVACVGASSVDCINTLSGEGKFEVLDGKMPKLGSLEYLLKAGNLITSGVTGVSINGIIDLITPLKTGNFSSISGQVQVKDGVANDIQVYSAGKDLNMYLTGTYNIATLMANMEVYGSLSKNFSTILGKIGNSSLNTLFNTIPGIKINEINPTSTSNIHKIPNFDKTNTLRVFKAEIVGDINGSNYVKSFRWIKD